MWLLLFANSTLMIILLNRQPLFQKLHLYIRKVDTIHSRMITFASLWDNRVLKSIEWCVFFFQYTVQFWKKVIGLVLDSDMNSDTTGGYDERRKSRF